jgi:hypothetical protein
MQIIPPGGSIFGANQHLSFYSEQSGFLFPNELPKNYYSPGLFLVEPENNGSFSYGYTFDAMDNSNRISLNLIRANEGDPNSTLYVVRTKHYGSFWFNLEIINNGFRYLGKKPQLIDHNPLAVAMTTDSDKLEKICKNYNFYFIGSTLPENDL